jgi:hypothetical protein
LLKAIFLMSFIYINILLLCVEPQINTPAGGLLVITAATFVRHSPPAGVLITKTEIDDWGGVYKNMNNLQKNRSRLQKNNINLK